MSETLLQEVLLALTPLGWEERIKKLREFGDCQIMFSTSFSMEDQMITHVIAQDDAPVNIFTIDTGRLFEQTHETFQKTLEAYPNIAIETYFPNANLVQDMVKGQGINGFYDSVEKRKNCCHVRKVEPLNRALYGADIWISGLRREHSNNRGGLPIAEYDEQRNIIKLYPLIDVPDDAIRPYISEHLIPYNILHDRGFPSIGCVPCTRAIEPGEHPRAGRWWWEEQSAQECGLHVQDGKLVRIRSANA